MNISNVNDILRSNTNDNAMNILNRKLNKYYLFGLVFYIFSMFFVILIKSKMMKFSEISEFSNNVNFLNQYTLPNLRNLDNVEPNSDNVDLEFLYKHTDWYKISEMFLNQINGKEYNGTWYKQEDSKNEFLDYFQNNNGSVSLKFSIQHTDNLNEQKVLIEYNLKDGKYRDRAIKINQEFTYYHDNEPLSSLSFKYNSSYGEIFNKYKNVLDSKTIRNKLFINLDEVSCSTNKMKISFSYNFMNIVGQLQYDDIGISILFQGSIVTVENDTRKISNFSLCLCFIGIIHLYHILKVIREMLLGELDPKKFSLTFVSFNIIWNAILCIGTLFVAINIPKYFNDFSIPSFIFFIDFAVFQIRLLFLVWRAHNLESLVNADEAEIRKKMFKFYILLCNKFY